MNHFFHVISGSIWIYLNFEMRFGAKRIAQNPVFLPESLARKTQVVGAL